jgi:DNA-binding MarR family transcriptional regulator
MIRQRTGPDGKSTSLSGRAFSAFRTVVRMNSPHAPLTLGSLVVTVFDLTRLGLPADAGRIAGRLGVETARIARGLELMERQGLATRHASEARLTLAGLALASQLDALRGQPARSEARAVNAEGPSANGAPRSVAA